ncbi:MAG: tail fiber protein [Chitinophagaceae bacterium]
MDNYLGEIRAFSFGRIPRNWAPCNGQTMAINTNQALFSLLGTTYGGNGVTTFNLPNLQGRAALHFGNYTGPYPSYYTQGQAAGTESVTVLQTNLPAHTHPFALTAGAGTTNLSVSSPGVDFLSVIPEVPQVPNENMVPYTTSLGSGAVQLNPNCIAPTGGTQPHENRMPYLPILFCIALTGIFPSRD